MPVIQGSVSFGFNDAEFRLEPADQTLQNQRGRLLLKVTDAQFRIEFEGLDFQATNFQAAGSIVGAGMAQAVAGSFQAPRNFGQQQQPVCRQLNFEPTSPAPSIQGPRATSSPTGSSPGSNPNRGRIPTPDLMIISGTSAVAPSSFEAGRLPNNYSNVTPPRQTPPTFTNQTTDAAARGQQQARFPNLMPSNFQYANCTCSCTPCSPLTLNQPTPYTGFQVSQNTPPFNTNTTGTTEATSYGSTIGQIDMTMSSNETSNSQMAQAVSELLQDLEVSGISIEEVRDCIRERSQRSFNSVNSSGPAARRFQ